MAVDTGKLVRREIEIFAVGRWQDKTGHEQVFATADLREIAENFKRLRAVHRPPLKLGHSTNQVLQEQSDGDPALGWVEGLRVSEDGRKLLATVEMPRAVVELIEARLYENVSVELLLDVRYLGRRIGTVLRAVALLGADLPAVSDLAGLRALAASAAHSPSWARNAEERTFCAELGEVGSDVQASQDAKNQIREEKKMEEIERLERTVEGLAATVKGMEMKLTAQGTTVHEAEIKRAAAESELAQFRAREQAAGETARTAAYQTGREALLGKLDAKVTAGVVSPDLRKRVAAELDEQAGTFKQGDALRFSAEMVLELIELVSPKLPLGVQGLTGADDALSAGDALAEKIAEIRRKSPELSSAAAFQQALSLYPELARRHAAATEPEADAA